MHQRLRTAGTEIKVSSVENQELTTVFHLKPRIGQNITSHACFATAKNFFLALISTFLVHSPSLFSRNPHQSDFDVTHRTPQTPSCGYRSFFFFLFFFLLGMRVNTRYINCSRSTSSKGTSSEGVPLVEFMFTRIPDESYRRRLGFSLCLCEVFRVLINCLVC